MRYSVLTNMKSLKEEMKKKRGYRLLADVLNVFRDHITHFDGQRVTDPAELDKLSSKFREASK